MWRCSECRAVNEETIYRCHQCDRVKPYLPVPAATDSPSSSSSPPPLSPSNVFPQYGELGEGRGSQAAHGVGPAVTEMTSFGSRVDPWAGARPKEQPTGRVVWGHVSSSSPEDRQPLLSGRGERGEAEGGGGFASRPRRPHSGQRPLDHFMLSFPDTECRLVLIGRTGNGKSSAGNTILGMARFQEGGGFGSETTSCQMFRVNRFGIDVDVVDTPGFFDTDTPEDLLLKEIRKCIGMVTPGPHVIALVIGGRFTNEQVETVEQVRALFGSDVMDRMLVIFTFGDQLSRGQGEGRCADIIQEKVEKAPVQLRKLIKEELKNRYVVFNNEGPHHEKDHQVRELLRMAGTIVSQNPTKHFTAPLLIDCDNAVQNYEARVLALLNTSDAMTRQQVRRVFQTLTEREESTTEFLETLLHSQEEAAQARQELEVAKELMATHIRQHKVKTDELMAELNRPKCVVL